MSGYSRWDDLKADLYTAEEIEEIERGAQRLVAVSRGYSLAEARRAVGMTQAQVAERMGVTKARVSQIERGDLAVLDTGVIQRYAAALDATMTIILDFGDQIRKVA